ncbi:MAG: formamidopyrimidine-DNA glycosylase [Pseudomonadota bacterium]|jgi:formamidopyrimidine-DNA glycosylase
MPELPEVETTLRGIAPYVSQTRIIKLVVRESRLRWPISEDLGQHLEGATIGVPFRRGKYILLPIGVNGTLMIHLGMSGSLRIVDPDLLPRKHDHVDFVLESGRALRFHDPRRFGCILYTEAPTQHPLLRDLGPEPFDEAFDGHYLHQEARNRKTSVKAFIMDSHTVVGVGNIYASESLFGAGISPARAAGKISLIRYERLAQTIRTVLSASIAQGGTTLRDFVNATGNPGYFRQTLNVYEREGEPCRVCETPVRMARQAQRATYWCPRCQT